MDWFTLGLLALGGLLLWTRHRVRNDSPPRRESLLVAIWGVLALASWLVMYLAAQAFTVSHLAGGYFCCTEAQFPAAGSTARAISEFWRGVPGRYLLPIALIAGSVALALWHRRRGSGFAITLMHTFRINLAFVVLSLALSLLGWAISDWINGPVGPPFHGLDRTWPGIALHALLWIAYFHALATMHRPARPPRLLRRASTVESVV
jgi:hypothetical protein